MASDLSTAMASLRLSSEEASKSPGFLIDDLLKLGPQRPTKRRKKLDADLIKANLEQKYLYPSQRFSLEWLNKLQQRFPIPSVTDAADLLSVSPTMTRTTTLFERRGLAGRVTGYKSVTLPPTSAALTAKNSTSFLRKPGSRADFVRGAAGFYPFAPGGLESVESELLASGQLQETEAAATTEDKLNKVITLSGDGRLLEIAPGLERGIDFTIREEKESQIEEAEAKDVEGVLMEEPEANEAEVEAEPPANGEAGGDEAEEDGEDIDSLLPIEFPALEPHGSGLAASNQRTKAGREWAHMVDVGREITNFSELVPDPARTWPFELDTFQKEAIYHLENGDSVFVAAHTSAGKTVVAEYAIALAARHRTKAIYTSPIKALSNQKFRDFRNTFDDVGILTGDVQINPEASCLIMTTEILRSMLYRGADLIRDVQYVIFDEVHYVNDLERGVVWEEVIIMLPEQVSLILLSATVPNTYEFASWVGRTKRKNIYVISTPKRPVPLEHFLWAGRDLYRIVDAEKRFLEKGWKDADAAMRGKDKAKPIEPAQTQGAAAARGSPNQRGANRGGSQRGGPNQRGGQRGGGGPQRGGAGRGGPPTRASHAPGHMGRGSGRAGGFTTLNQDRNLWVHLIQHLRRTELLPACIFVFSKKRVEENAAALSNQDYLPSQSDKSAVYMIVERSLARLRPEDRVLPQILRLRELLSRGIAVHHGGLLPIVKELVEMLFAQSLVKVLFATETFAMGLNLPTRTVVFSGCRKHDGHSFRNLLPGEYTQMAGRAGRRGLDKVGSVIIVPPAGSDEVAPAAELRRMILGEPSKLRSQFRLTYNMMLNLLRVEALKVEEMIKRSFSEHATQQLLPQHEQAVRLGEADLARVRRDSCDTCDQKIPRPLPAIGGGDDDPLVGAMDAAHDAAVQYDQLTTELYAALLKIPVGRKMFAPGRLIVYSKDGPGGIRTPAILLAEGASTGGKDGRAATSSEPTVHVCEVRVWRDTRDSTDLLPFLPAYRRFLTLLPPGPGSGTGGGRGRKKGGKRDENAASGSGGEGSNETATNYNIQIKTLHVPLSDVRCLTRHVTKGVVPEIFQGGEAYQQARARLVDIARSWRPDHYWEEMSFARVKSLALQEMVTRRRQLAEIAENSPALACKDFVKHFAMCHDQYVIKSHISALQAALSDQNLQLLPDYEQRVLVLRDLGFIEVPEGMPASTSARIQLKGKVACEIHSGDELALTELILDNVLAEFDAAEIAALLSSFVFQERSPIDAPGSGLPPNLPPHLEKGIEAIRAIADKVNAVQERHQVVTLSAGGGNSDEGSDFAFRPRFGLVEVVYEWARGMSFRAITELTDVLEGTIVRTISRLDETCREVRNAARIIGDPELHRKMERAQELIRRDIMAVASLYM